MDETKKVSVGKYGEICKAIIRAVYLLKLSVGTVCAFFVGPILISAPTYMLLVLGFDDHFLELPALVCMAILILILVMIVLWTLVLPFLLFAKSKKVFCVGNIIFAVLNLADAVYFAYMSTSLVYFFIVGALVNIALVVVSAFWIFKVSKKCLVK